MNETNSGTAWLQRLVGEWTYSFRTADDSEYPGATATGMEIVRAVSDQFVVIENDGSAGDGTVTRSVTLLGYEPDNNRFTGAVAGTAAAMLFVYDGKLSEDGRSLLLETSGPAMTEGNTTDRYRDVLQVIDGNIRSTAAEVFQDGGWKEFMRTTYRRKR